jgi:hypothetical protein
MTALSLAFKSYHRSRIHMYPVPATPQRVAELFAQFENLIVSYAAHPDLRDRDKLLEVNVSFRGLVSHRWLNLSFPIHSLTSMRR